MATESLVREKNIFSLVSKMQRFACLSIEGTKYVLKVFLKSVKYFLNVNN
jgi:hypothetical protein